MQHWKIILVSCTVVFSLSVAGLTLAASPSSLIDVHNNEMSLQHDMLKDDLGTIQDAIATVQTTVDNLQAGGNGPPCGPGTEGQRFVTTPDGLDVCDNTTRGLYWEQDPNGPNRGSMLQADALAFCAGLNKGNGQTYRLPSIQELVSVLDYTQFNPSLTVGVFSNVDTVYHWSTTRRVLVSGNVWLVDITNGELSAADTGSTKAKVWCVRSGV